MSNKPVNQATFFTGSYDGRIHAYDMSKDICEPIQGASPTNAIMAIDTSEDGKAYFAGMDDTVREIAGTPGQFTFAYVDATTA